MPVTSFALKIVAIVTMTIDHICSIIGQAGFMVLLPDASLSTTFYMSKLFHIIGRMAFPIFAFMLAEGSAKTHSMPRYLGRLALFAVISEPFFFYAFNRDPSMTSVLDSLARLNFTNVFFTLFLGALSIFICQKLTEKYAEKGQIVSALCAIVLAFAGEYFKTDYGAMGVLLIVTLYFTREKRSMQCVEIVLWAFLLYPGWTSLSPGMNLDILDALGASLACIPILLYNGKRGRPMKWTFYVYYPAHLLALTLIAGALGV